MGNLDCLSQAARSLSAVDADYEARHKPRLRLGLSQIGHQCRRWLWYQHHGKPAIAPTGRTLRLFQLGNIIEEQLATDLLSAGFNLHSRQKYIEFTQGPLKLHGSCDGIIEGLLESSKPHLWECKSMASKGFSKMLKDGYEAYNPQYKAQLHVYMLGLKLNRAFVTVYCKDTSELYQELVTLDREFAIDRLNRAFESIESPIEPDRHCPRQDYFEAKWCQFREICWGCR